MNIPDDIWLNIIKFLDVQDVITLGETYKRVWDLCERYPLFIYKEILKQKGFVNFDNFTIDMFTTFCKLDPLLKLSTSNLLYAYESKLVNVVIFLLDNLPKTSYILEMEQKNIAEYIHRCWTFYFRDIRYDVMNITQLYDNLLIELIRFNVLELNSVKIPISISDENKKYIYNKICSKIEFQSMGSLFFHIAIMQNNWEYILDTIDIIGLEYYEDAY